MIRHATEHDLAALVALGREMHAEAPALRDAAYDARKVELALRGAVAIGAAFVHETDGAIDGVFAGLVVEHWFSEDKMATDLALFVPQGRRGGFIAIMLLERFIAWCADNSIDNVQIGVTTGVNPERTGKFYEQMGFRFIGGNYQMRLNGHAKESDHLHRG